MAIEVKIANPHLTIHHDYGVMVSERDGSIRENTQKGLFFRDTRIISGWRLTCGGEPWTLLNSENETYHSTRIVLVNPKLTAAFGELPARTLGVTITRDFGGGLHEDIDLQNYGRSNARLSLGIEIKNDFADLFEVKGGQTVQRSGIVTTWSEGDGRLSVFYRRKDFRRGLTVSVRNSNTPAGFAGGTIGFEIELAPGQRWHACLLYDLFDGDERCSAPDRCPGLRCAEAHAEAAPQERHRVTTLRSASASFNGIVHQAIEDLAALRLHVPGTTGQPIPAGGVPWFLSLFGRDSIIASLQYQVVDPGFSRGALERLAALQADGVDDYRDAQPGKIPHELRHGELAFFREIPHTPYYGTADATALYLILLHSTWRWTGDADLLHHYLGTAERCLHWIDAYGDLDGDGLQEYQTRSSAGYENQGWKDAGDAIVYPDGSLVKGPKAVCELQGYVYDAWLRMAEIFEELGNTQRALQLRRKAAHLYRIFNDTFWDEHEGFYALALDGDKRPVKTVGSNPGHCLWSGIVPAERAPRVVRRLLQPDMWSGWGIRTLSSAHPAYNPFSYQNGSVWPHDNSIIALGMKRYGFAHEAAKVARALCDAASYFISKRLPELFAGTSRAEISFPLRYLESNVPQAWATGAIFALVQALIGFEPNAPHHRMLVDPTLPDWLPEFEVKDLSIDGRRVDLRFWRQGEETLFEVCNGDPHGIERQHFPKNGVFRKPSDGTSAKA